MRFAGFLAALGLAFAFSSAAADHKEDFKKGMEAADRERWGEAAEHFRDAIASEPVESEERVFLSGVFSAPYLPHFQLGRSLSQSSRDHCPEALQEWALSESHGVVTKFGELFEELVSARNVCRQHLLPAAIGVAQTEIETAATALLQLAKPTEETLARERRAAADELEQARQDLQRGQTESNLDAVYSATEAARRANQQLDHLAKLVESHDAHERQNRTADAARQAVEDAEAALRTLDRLTEEELQAHEALELKPQIAFFRERLRRADDFAEWEELEQEASDAAAELRQATQEILDQIAKTGATSATPDPTNQEPTVASLRAPPSLPREADSDPVQKGSVPEPTEPGPATGLLASLLAEADRLLETADPQAHGSRLLSLQHERLREIASRLRQGRTDDRDQLLERLAESMAAIRWMTGAQRFFSGQSAEALELLAEAETWPRDFAGQALLLRAAARFSASRLDPTFAPRHLGLASDDLRLAKSLDDGLAPDPSLFSPDFLRFFEQATQPGEIQNR